MTPWLDDGDVRLYHGDALEVLRQLPDESVDCVVTSPPYWGLRSYLPDGHDDKPRELGLEPTPDLFVQRMVEVFREIRRVLAAHGTCWVNLGDSYAHGVSMTTHSPSMSVTQKQAARARGETIAKAGTRHDSAHHDVPPGLKVKDLVGVPWRVAFALQADGWYLRSDIVWAKPNPMPESVTDRPTKAHEYVFLLTKAPRYWFDQEAVREGYAPASEDRYRYAFGGAKNEALAEADKNGIGVRTRPIGMRTFPGQPPEAPRGPDGRRNTHVQAGDGSIQHRDGDRWPNAGRNIRSVWQIATQPYPEAHFATFPEELARRCVLAGCPLEVCRVCGKARERIVERERVYDHTTRAVTSLADRNDLNGGADGHDVRHGPSVRTETLGWTSCECPAPGTSPSENRWGLGLPEKYRPGVVLDPFIGSGTVAKVARDHGRHAIGIDLNADYLALAARRLQQLSLLSEAQA